MGLYIFKQMPGALVTSYLSTKNSGKETLGRVETVAKDIESLQYNIEIYEAYDSIVKIF
jgi:hypothetical protein